MKSVVKLFGFVVLCLPVFAYALSEDIAGLEAASFLTVENVWHATEMYGSVALIAVGLMSLAVARKRQKSQ